jgi:hypothetical protein
VERQTSQPIGEFVVTIALALLVLVLAIICAVLLLSRRRHKLDRKSAMRAHLSTPAAQLEFAQAFREARLLTALEQERSTEILRLANQELSNVPPRPVPSPATAA